VSATKFHTPYETKGKVTVLQLLIFTFLDIELEDKRFCTEWQQAFSHFNLLLISSWIDFWSFRVVPRYLNCSTVSNDSLPIHKNKYWRTKALTQGAVLLRR
jgi:hypothetical protein